MKVIACSLFLSTFILLTACGSEEVSKNRPYEELNKAEISTISHDEIEKAPLVTYEQLVNGEIEKGAIIKISGTSSPISDNHNDDDWGSLSIGDQFDFKDMDYKKFAIRNEDDSFKESVSKNINIYGTFNGTTNEKLSKENKELGLSAITIPLVVAYKVEERKLSKKEIIEDNKNQENVSRLSSQADIKSAANPAHGEVLNLEILEYPDGSGLYDITLDIRYDSISKTQALKDTKEIMEKMFNTNLVNDITIKWYAELVDNLGVKKVETVLTVGIKKKTADNIDWDQFNYENMENVADEYSFSQALN